MVRAFSILTETDALASSLSQKTVLAAGISERGYDTKAEHIDGRIPGSIMFLVNDISDHSTEIPYMLPD